MTTINELIEFWKEEKRLHRNGSLIFDDPTHILRKNELADQAMLIEGQLEELKQQIIPFEAYRAEAALRIMAALSNNEQAQRVSVYEGYCDQLAERYSKVAVIFADALIKELNSKIR